MPLKKKYGRPAWWVLCALWLAVIFGHSLMPADLSKAESLGLLARLTTAHPFLTDHLLRKFAHFSEFALLGLLLSQCFRAGFVSPVLAALLCALSDETIQLHVLGRSGQVRDVWIDFAGALVTIGLTFLVRTVARRVRSGRPGPGESA